MRFSIDLHNRFREQASWTRQAQQFFLANSGIKAGSKVLEVGCGTGALIESVSNHCPALFFGIDIQFDLLSYASLIYPQIPLTCSDALRLPFRSGTFDAVISHFFLLWVKDIDQVMQEINRIIRPGGLFAALAEPDYGSRIDYPEEFVQIGRMQRESLISQGADPDLGKKLGTLFIRNGFKDVSQGILGSFQSHPCSKEAIESEQRILRSDVNTQMDETMLNHLMEMDTRSRLDNSRVQFVPTFFAWGSKPCN